MYHLWSLQYVVQSFSDYFESPGLYSSLPKAAGACSLMVFRCFAASTPTHCEIYVANSAAEVNLYFIYSDYNQFIPQTDLQVTNLIRGLIHPIVGDSSAQCGWILAFIMDMLIMLKNSLQRKEMQESINILHCNSCSLLHDWDINSGGMRLKGKSYSVSVFLYNKAPIKKRFFVFGRYICVLQFLSVYWNKWSSGI